MRQRRVVNEAPPAPELEKRKQSAANEKLHICVPLSLIAVRLLSAVVNTVHDCDEVFNFWEPLHFLLHGYGLQTWENSPRFALRSYTYLLPHAAVLLPQHLLLESAAAKRAQFHTLRAILGLACAFAEASMCRAVARTGGMRLAYLTWAILVSSSGMFTASTTFLPSTFAMVTFCIGASFSLEGRHKAAVVTCVAGGLLGWPFAGLAAVPIGLRALAHIGFLPVLTAATAAACSLVIASLGVDSQMYGQVTLPMWNLIKYNVVGGGDSALYGVESPLFYLRNTFNAFNLALLLALVTPVAEVAAAFASQRRLRGGLLGVVSSMYLWMGVMSAVPHKEERFMYIIYPQLCLGAALTLHAACEFFESRFIQRRARGLRFVAYALIGGLVTGMALISAARTAAVIGNYDAPMKVYAKLPPSSSHTPQQLVCVGAEWYRFPSSFYLPGPAYRLGFVKTAFSGLLPMAFNVTAGGTAYASPALNDRNQEVAEQYVRKPGAECNFWVGLEEEQAPAGARWMIVAKSPFLDAGRSPALWRAFQVPGVSSRKNAYTNLVLKRREK